MVVIISILPNLMQMVILFGLKHPTGNVIEGGRIALDAAGNIYCTGDFIGEVDFDPGAGVFKLNSVLWQHGYFCMEIN